MILTIQPVASVVLGIVLRGEAPGALQLAGAALILSGLLSLARRRREPVSAPAASRSRG